MARDLFRPIPTTVVPQNGGVEVPIELPKDSAYRALLLRFSVTTVDGTGATLTATASILELIRNIRLVADGKMTLYSIDGFSLRELNRIWFGSTPPETTFALASATYEVSLILPFAQPYLYDSAVGLLPAVPLSGLTLYVNVGTWANLVVTPGTDTFVMTITGETWEVLDLAKNLAVSPQVVSQSVFTVVSGTDIQHQLKRGNRLAAVLLSARSYNGGTTILGPSTLVTRAKMYQTAEGSGPQYLRNQGYNENRAWSRIIGNVVAAGQVSDLNTGFMYLNFHGDGRASSPLDMSGTGTDGKLLFDAAASGTNPQVIVTEVEIIPRAV
jgi:hypothetical protein